MVVSSAGNDGDNTVYFSGVFSTVLCIGSVNERNNGPASFSNAFNGIDLLAPGIKLATVGIRGETIKVSGTSFSAAWVTGIAASMLISDPSLTPYEIRQILISSAKDICSKGYDINSGWGILNLEEAMKKLYEKDRRLSFIDIPENAYYRNDVNWAIKRGITDGTTINTFSPDMNCTRAQAVIFLWRAVGSPEPRITKNPFDDVSGDNYFYKSVLWAFEKGITSGTSKKVFSPNEICNEAQLITFIWRALNCPDSLGRSHLAGKLGEHYYTDAVAWADTNGILDVVPVNFSPETVGTRAKIIAYLYQSMGFGF